MPARVLVTGATGFVGRSLLPGLLAAGHDVRAGSRHPDRLRGSTAATPVRVDVGDPTTLDAALEGCDVAYYLIHGLADRGDFAEIEDRAAENFAVAAARHRVRVVYLGGLGAGGHQVDRSPHLVSRHRVGQILRRDADTVELQAAVVLGHGSAMYETLRDLARIPVLVGPDWVDTRTQPIAGRDAVAYLTAAPSLAAGTYQIGGADVLSYADMLTRYARHSGRRVRIVRFPVAAPRVAAHAVARMTEVVAALPGATSPRVNPFSDQPPALLLRLAEGLSVETIVTDDRIRALVALDPLGFDAACELADADAARAAGRRGRRA